MVPMLRVVEALISFFWIAVLVASIGEGVRFGALGLLVWGLCLMPFEWLIGKLQGSNDE